MKITMKDYTYLIGSLLMGLSTVTLAGAMGTEVAASPGTLYIGGFGGGGGAQSAALVQKGTALYNYDAVHVYLDNAGPLAVNALGQSKSAGVWMAGGQIGYRFPDRSLANFYSDWTIAPAVELEGYYLGRSTMRGDDINNETDRLAEHDFQVTYPMNTGVFLVNFVVNSSTERLGNFHPYVGVGAGVAGVSISGANSLQTSPLEAGINHYNSDTSDMAIALAAQPKVGISWHLQDKTNVFLEYRFLYLSSTNFNFGSTEYPTHVATTNWNVRIGSQYFNMVTAGIQFNV